MTKASYSRAKRWRLDKAAHRASRYYKRLKARLNRRAVRRQLHVGIEEPLEPILTSAWDIS